MKHAGLFRTILMALRSKTFILLLAALLSLGLASDAFARAGGGFSMGSRGGRTYSAPPVTSVAPRSASPIQRSTTPNAPGFNQNYGRSPGMFGNSFGRGLFGGLLGGFLGAGLFGLLFGHGLFGGLGGGASLLGLLLQIGVIYLLVRFAMNFFRNRQMAFNGPPNGSYGGPMPGSGGFGGMGGAPSGTPLPIDAADYNMFEQRLSEVETAYSNEDLSGLRRFATPEMVGYFSEELSGNARRGVVNRMSNIKLVKGDLAEAWREGGAEYATVAMQFQLIDTMVDRASGRVVSGDPNVPDQATELWTFVRAAGSGPDAWMLSAIQQS
jgi:predicted lipid-binding transport protein (Tim44 family)